MRKFLFVQPCRKLERSNAMFGW